VFSGHSLATRVQAAIQTRLHHGVALECWMDYGEQGWHLDVVHGLHLLVERAHGAHGLIPWPVLATSFQPMQPLG
jgi:hypothetical protein